MVASAGVRGGLRDMVPDPARCLGMVHVTALPRQRLWVPDMRARISDAATACAHISNRSTIMPEPIQVLGHDLASLLMGMGIEVFRGPHTPQTEFPPVILVGALGIQPSRMTCRLALTREIHPGTAVCVITGSLADPKGAAFNPVAHHDDARACLLAAGIGFISEDEVLDAAKA